MRIRDWSSDVCSSDLLLDGGVDFILIETIFDTLNAKAGIMAVIEAGEARGTEIPLMLSMTLTDMSGRNLSGHRSEEHTSELQSLMRISYAVFCLKNKKQRLRHTPQNKHITPIHK